MDSVMSNFRELNTPESLVLSLERMKITIPTPIQVLAIPPALEGKDILASAQTGTGKTIAFLVPLISKLMNNPESTALVIAPTRELAIQVRDAAVQIMGRSTSIHTALLIGGDPMPKQFMQLRRKPRIIVGTPGRITDHLYRNTITLEKTSFVVIDEMDRMLDIGLREQLDDIRSHLPQTCQTLMFSATMPAHILTISQEYLKDPARLSVGATNQAAPKIEQKVVHTNMVEKFDHLIKELEAHEGSVIIFVRTKRGAAQLAEKLNRTIITDNNKMVADAIHGDLRQSKRERVLLTFRNGKYRILVATDVAARGLDVPHVKKVINWELPENAEDFLHRIGRTGRAGAEGYAVSFVTPDQRRKLDDINRFINPAAYAAARQERGGEHSSGRSFGGGARRSGGRSSFGGSRSSDGNRSRSRSSFGSSWSSDRSERPEQSSEQRTERSERAPRSEGSFRSSDRPSGGTRGSSRFNNNDQGFNRSRTERTSRYSETGSLDNATQDSGTGRRNSFENKSGNDFSQRRSNSSNRSSSDRRGGFGGGASSGRSRFGEFEGRNENRNKDRRKTPSF